MTRIAVIGAGRMGKRHAGELKKIAGCELAGIYDPVKSAADGFCSEFGPEKKYASEKELAADSGLDGVVICNYTDQHAKTLALLLESGIKRIFCEKPAVRTRKEAKKVLELAKKEKALVMVGHHKRHIPAYARINDMVKSGELGKIRMAKVDWCSAGYSRGWGEFFSDFERSGGAIIDMMSHLFDQMNWDFGDPQSVCGKGVMLDRSQPMPMDYISGTVVYKSGTICNVNCSWQRYGVGTDVFEVYGDKACVIYSGGNKLHVYRKDERTEISLGDPTPIMVPFVDMVRSGTAPLVSLEDGVNSALVALAMIEASQKGKVVDFAKFK